MKIALTICAGVVVVVLVAIVAFNTLPRAPSQTAVGTFDDLPRYLLALQQSKEPYAFLVVTVSGTEDFLQFMYEDDTLIIDFPLATPRQQGLESAFRSALVAHNLEPIDLTTSTGQRILDAKLPLSNSQAADVIYQLFSAIYGTSQSAELIFNWDGFSLNDA